MNITCRYQYENEFGLCIVFNKKNISRKSFGNNPCEAVYNKVVKKQREQNCLNNPQGDLGLRYGESISRLS